MRSRRLMPSMTFGRALRTANVRAIERYVKDRLSSIFKGAVLDPVTYDRNNAPFASLFFCVANPSRSAVKVATTIAGHIVRKPVRPKGRIGLA
jgi:hypothetical protein